MKFPDLSWKQEILFHDNAAQNDQSILKIGIYQALYLQQS